MAQKTKSMTGKPAIVLRAWLVLVDRDMAPFTAGRGLWLCVAHAQPAPADLQPLGFLLPNPVWTNSDKSVIVTAIAALLPARCANNVENFVR